MIGVIILEPVSWCDFRSIVVLVESGDPLRGIALGEVGQYVSSIDKCDGGNAGLGSGHTCECSIVQEGSTKPCACQIFRDHQLFNSNGGSRNGSSRRKQVGK